MTAIVHCAMTSRKGMANDRAGRAVKTTIRLIALFQGSPPAAGTLLAEAAGTPPARPISPPSIPIAAPDPKTTGHPCLADDSAGLPASSTPSTTRNGRYRPPHQRALNLTAPSADISAGPNFVRRSLGPQHLTKPRIPLAEQAYRV